MAEYYFKEFEDYLRTLCMLHKDVLHDDINNRAFIRFQSEEDIQSIPNNAGAVMVAVVNFTGRAIGSIEEEKLQQYAGIWVFVNISNTAGNVYAAIQAAMKKAMDVMFDFYTRMIKDSHDDNCGPLRFLQPEQMTFSPIDGPINENAYGWEWNIPFKVNTPAYNATKWNLP